MIQLIGVVCQDASSFGFLEGLKRRLNCSARLIEPTTGALGKSTTLTRKQAKLAALDLQKKGVDLLVRFTDADRNRWQEILRHEQDVFPGEFKSIILCGVAVENIEHWLGLDRGYIEKELGVANAADLGPVELTGAIKNAIARRKSLDEPVSEVTARLVAGTPPDIFRAWLKADSSLRNFYQECRAAAIRSDCQVPNELDA